MSVWGAKFTWQERRDLETWWKWYNAQRMASPNWPPKWEPAKPRKRWKKR